MKKWERDILLILTLLVALVLVAPVRTAPNLYPSDASVSERTKATYDEKKANKELALRYAKIGYGYNDYELRCLDQLWTLESRFDNYARPRDNNGRIRSTAYGIAQHLGTTSSDPATQILIGLRYIEEHRRYKGSACRALQFHRIHHWY